MFSSGFESKLKAFEAAVKAGDLPKASDEIVAIEELVDKLKLRIKVAKHNAKEEIKQQEAKIAVLKDLLG